MHKGAPAVSKNNPSITAGSFLKLTSLAVVDLGVCCEGLEPDGVHGQIGGEGSERNELILVMPK